MDEIQGLQDKIKNKLHELRNIRREDECLKSFIKFKSLNDEYDKFRIAFYKGKQGK
jgi:hypothetical protein